MRDVRENIGQLSLNLGEAMSMNPVDDFQVGQIFLQAAARPTYIDTRERWKLQLRPNLRTIVKARELGLGIEMLLRYLVLKIARRGVGVVEGW